MDMLATPVTLSREEILRRAKGKGGLLGRLFVRQPLTELRLEYVRFYMVRLPYDVEARRFPFRRHETGGVMSVAVNALYGRCAMKDTELALAPVQGGHFQNGRFEMAGGEAEELAIKEIEGYSKGGYKFSAYETKPEVTGTKLPIASSDFVMPWIKDITYDDPETADTLFLWDFHFKYAPDRKLTPYTGARPRKSSDAK